MISCMILSFTDNPISISDDESDNDDLLIFFLSKQHPGH